jgi:hypothetical protein
MNSQLTFFYSVNSQDREISLVSENNSACVVTSDEFMSNFDFSLNSSVCYDHKNLSEFADLLEINKIIVHKTECIDKIIIGNLIAFADRNNINIDFYGNRVGKDGFLPDTIEYLLLRCDIMKPSL